MRPTVAFSGLRVFYLDASFRLRTHLLAVKEICPDVSVDKKITGEAVMKWTRQVLHQFGLQEKDIAGVVTDAGGVVGGGVASTLQWEWSVPHMLNRVTTDGTGMSLAKETSKNLPCRELLVQMETIVELFNKSELDKVGLTFHSVNA